MPNTRSAAKRLRVAQRATERKKPVRSRLTSARRAFMESLDRDGRPGAEEAYRAYSSILDKAAKKGVIQRNTADRRKAWATRKLQAR